MTETSSLRQVRVMAEVLKDMMESRRRLGLLCDANSFGKALCIEARVHLHGASILVITVGLERGIEVRLVLEHPSVTA